MRLESALFAGREGITVHGQAISVVGDNIANSNTVGFKGSRTEFEDILSDGAGGLQSTNIEYGGTGVALGRVRPLLSKGGVIEPTGRSLDMAIDGNGFFMTGDAAAPQYTRAGNFNLDQNGNLVSADGQQVLGYQGEATALSALNLYNLNLTGSASTQVSLVGNIDATSAITAKPVNPQTFNEIAAAASYTAPASVYDSLGARHGVTLAFFKTAANTYTVTAYADSGDTGGTKGQPTEIGNSNMTFDENGAMVGTSSLAASAAWTGGAAAGNFTIDLSQFSQFASASGLQGTSQNGSAVGNIKTYEVDKDGNIFAMLDSGSTELVGSIALATFRNVDGLSRSGSSKYLANPEAGEAIIGKANSGPLGSIQGSALERSTVDLSDEFVNLVVYQRGYQANSQSLNAVNELLKQTIAQM